MKKLRFISFFTISIVIMALHASFAGENLEPAILEIAGKAKIMAAPNMATFSIGVETTSDRAQDAVKENASQIDRILSVLKNSLVRVPD